MRTAFILLTTAVVLVGSGTAEARRHLMNPVGCPVVGSRNPFYAVRASQIGGGRVDVAGTYRLRERNSRLSLVQAGGSGSRLLRLSLRRRAGPITAPGCLHFRGSFRAPSAREVRITDWRGIAVNTRVR